MTDDARRCACCCNCPDIRALDCDDLCESCWRLWCLAHRGHAPVADRSYMGTYGVTGVWAGWMMGQGVAHLLAEPAGDLQRREIAPRCPGFGCDALMVRRPGAWKCYHHEEPVVTVVTDHFARSPQVKVL